MHRLPAQGLAGGGGGQGLLREPGSVETPLPTPRKQGCLGGASLGGHAPRAAPVSSARAPGLRYVISGGAGRGLLGVGGCGGSERPASGGGGSRAGSAPTPGGPGQHGFPAGAGAGRAGESGFVSSPHRAGGRGSGVHLLPSEAVGAGQSGPGAAPAGPVQDPLGARLGARRRARPRGGRTQRGPAAAAAAPALAQGAGPARGRETAAAEQPASGGAD